MEGKLCIIAADGSEVECYFISKLGGRYLSIAASRFGRTPVQPGMVLAVEYSDRYMAIEGVTKDRFYPIKLKVEELIELNGYWVGETEEQAKTAFSKVVAASKRAEKYGDVDLISMRVLPDEPKKDKE